MSGLSGVSRKASILPHEGSAPVVLDISALRPAIDAPPLDLALNAGETLTLFGDDLPALSRLLDTLAGFSPRLGGKILIKGEDVSGRAPALRRLRLVSARDPLLPHLTARDNIALALRATGLSAGDAQAGVAGIISLLGLDGVAALAPKKLTREQTLRTRLARALVTRPNVLLLDDPFGDLSPQAARRIRTLLGTLSRALTLSVMRTVSRREDALGAGGRIAVFQGEKLLQCASAATLYDRPASPEVAMLFGEANILAGQVLDIGDDLARVQLACGGVAEAMTEGALQVGDECVVCVQPDRISPFFGKQTLAFEEDDNAPIRGTLCDWQHLGDHVRMRVRCAQGTEIELRRPPLQARQAPKSGASVQLAWPAAHATAFPLQGGMY